MSELQICGITKSCGSSSSIWHLGYSGSFTIWSLYKFLFSM